MDHYHIKGKGVTFNIGEQACENIPSKMNEPTPKIHPIFLHNKKMLIIATAILLFLIGFLTASVDLHKNTNKELYNHLFDAPQARIHDNDSVVGHLYAGYALMLKNRYKCAIDKFNKIPKGSGYIDAQWYLGLCLLIIEPNDEKIKKQFALIVAEGNYNYRQRALKVLNELEQRNNN